MMLWLCTVMLNIYTIRACYVDISVTTDNFSGVLNFTNDGYTGFFSMLLPDNPLAVCRLTYPFGFGTQTISIFTCSDLKVTDYGEYFECSVTKQTYFQCNRMKRTFICDDDKPWAEFHTRNSSATIPSVRVCLSSNIQRFAISFQETVSKDPNTLCLRPTHADTAIRSNVSSTGASGITDIPSSRLTTVSPVVEVNPISSSQTPLIVGLSIGSGILILVIIVIAIVCMRKRIPLFKTNRKELNSVNKSVAYDNPVMIPHGKSTIQFNPTKSCNNEIPKLKTNIQIVHQETNEAARKLATEFVRNREKNGEKMQLPTKQGESKTFGKLENRSNNFVNKAFLNLENDGKPLNVAGHAYGQVAIKSSDHDTVGSNYYYLMPRDYERARSTYI